MKKINNKGFMLTETLIVSTLLITVLLVVFVRFKSVNKNITNSLHYDSVSAMYNLYNLKKYVEQNNYSLMANNLEASDYVELTDCSNLYFSSSSYCEDIISNMGISKLIITKENLYSLIENQPFDADFNKYISYISYNASNGYRLIAAFKDGSYANIKVLKEKNFDLVISNACTPNVPKKITINHVKNSLLSSELLAPPTVVSAGCGTIVDFAEQYKINDNCYVAGATSAPNIVVNTDESLNVQTIAYNLSIGILSVQHQDMEGNTISATINYTGSCGSLDNPQKYAKTIQLYKFDHASEETITYGKGTTKNVVLYYKQ